MPEETEVRGWKKHRALFSAGLDELKKDMEEFEAMSEEEQIEALNKMEAEINHMTPEQKAKFYKRLSNGQVLK